MSVKIGNIDLGEFPLLLAPMEDVSDPPFRFVCKQNGVDMMYTEFISSEGLIRDAAKSRAKLDIFEYERPIGIQIFGSEIESMAEATRIATLANPDLIDINYGCPVKNVACRGAGASLLQDIDRMVEMTKAVVNATNLPVTVKTRLGWDDNTKNVYEVAERLQDIGIQALTIHGRTRAQMYKGEADWSLIREIKRNPRIKIPIFGNGDVNSIEKAANWRMEYEVDGIMIGRAAIGYPWIFREIKHFFKTGEHLPEPTITERVEVCKTHLDKSIAWKGPKVGVFEMRRHYSNYFKGIPDFKEYRMKLVSLENIDHIHGVLEEINERFQTEMA
ncbi:MAG: tRNA dihydrouridine synthase DusB [Sphingobacteriales bacterium 17-39-43]|uniref:tRNA dihydrouridine synthase DusB n=1 Tax=Daejeonella sp. TaxID=2805397 RepID=UPI000BD6E376|nr:tRNA dihydrouridine synthase DusB [Daejeonella sp.]OYY03044.1 MAG: tRNA dihydrouridine synthase DusB [Sphingobacteriia bacterium 35-40-5]OYZ32241.1 MAG: tRNA dihydrouridine synthase DusB [Sphingobacteriales bacterium 16-39-50]OZA25586.1 MAG: tRNA dihydrouridine synthase DusB [Sphingobacteriales bacterium 17-39-43]HQT22133.1 tRNA dihydrouridine synthase DusB [Daejeonella sp.]HQT57440.1 tRNA dihydrouridine synthase DusB [Daejeonella sp.]